MARYPGPTIPLGPPGAPPRAVIGPDGEVHPEGLEREAFGFGDYLLRQILATLQTIQAGISGLASATGGGAAGGGSSDGTVLLTDAVVIELAAATVGVNSTPTSLVMMLGDPPQRADLSTSVQNDLAGARIEFLGGAMQGVLRQVGSVTAAGVITPDAPFPQQPQPGTRFTLAKTQSQSQSGTIDLTEVGGATQTAADWTGLLSSPNTTLSVNEQTTLVANTAARLDVGVATRRTLIVTNNNAAGGAVLYIGGSNAVTTTSGYPVQPQGAVAMNMGPGLQLWGIATASTDVRLLELA